LNLTNAQATYEINTLSLHDALPIWPAASAARTGVPAARPSRADHCRSGRCAAARADTVLPHAGWQPAPARAPAIRWLQPARSSRSEEHTSELQSRENLVCRLLLEKK